MATKNFGLLQQHLRNVGRVIFDIQGHEMAKARADIPDNDTGTWGKDRRKENVPYVCDSQDDKCGDITRLMRFWLKFENVLPLAFIDPTARADHLCWTGPKAIEKLRGQHASVGSYHVDTHASIDQSLDDV